MSILVRVLALVRVFCAWGEGRRARGEEIELGEVMVLKGRNKSGTGEDRKERVHMEKRERKGSGFK